MRESNRSIRLPESWAADWVLDWALGSGPFSTVYRAVRQDRPDVEAVIKIIYVSVCEADVGTLLAEGMTLDQIKSYFDEICQEHISDIARLKDLKAARNIVAIEDCAVLRRPEGPGNEIFLRMPVLMPIYNLMRQRMLSPQEVIRLGSDICSALELCEKLGIIHQDVKPSGIFTDENTPGKQTFMLDVSGINRAMKLCGLTRRGGWLPYEAPEQQAGTMCDPRSDIYSLGIVLYRLLNNGHFPFMSKHNFSPLARENAMNLRYGGVKLPPPANGGRELREAVLKACAFRPEDRFRDAGEMKTALEAAGDSSC